MDHQALDTRIFPKRIDCGKPVLLKSCRDLSSSREQKEIGRDQNAIRSSIIQVLQSGLDLGTAASVENIDVDAQLFRSWPQRSQGSIDHRIGSIRQHGNARQMREKVFKQLQSLAF